MRQARPADRRYARECALNALYQVEVAKVRSHEALRQAYEAFDQSEIAGEILRRGPDEPVPELLTEELKHFAEELFRGVRDHEPELDRRLSGLTRDYDFDRLATVDKNVLRIAAFELFYMPDIPPAVTINEAVEIAKKYSTAESGKFVNGVLGRLVRESPKADWQHRPAGERQARAEEPYREPPPPVEEHVAEQGTEEAEQISKIGPWRLRSPSESE